MAKPSVPRQRRESRTATVAQLKADIDAGRTGDKVAHPDPAAAPLGTDEEAGGHPADPVIVSVMRRRELARAGTGPDPAGPGGAAQPETDRGGLRYMIGFGVLIAAGAVLVLLL